jgi:very-short-patch-repair endonuclease
VKTSNAEAKFILYWKAIKGQTYEREVQFQKGRKWRFDFAWPDIKVAVEVEGGVWMARGGHTTGSGYTGNCEKYNEALLDGWRVFRLTPDQITADYLIRIRGFLQLEIKWVHNTL